MMTTPPARPWYVTVIVVIFVIDGTNGAAQVVMRLLGESSDPSALVFWQSGVALSAWATAWAGWQLKRLAVGLAILNGAVLSLMLLRLPTMIEMEPEGVAGLRSAAAMIFVVVLLLAAGLYRGTRKT
jgi:hypothetical protein